jgi:hypothetical protein
MRVTRLTVKITIRRVIFTRPERQDGRLITAVASYP